MRRFLALPLLLAAASAQTPDFPVAQAQGFLSGEATATTVILQARLTSPSRYFDPYWSGVVGARGEARFEYSRAEDFSNPRRTEWLTARPEQDFIVKAVVNGLYPGTRYYFRLVYGPDRENTRTSAAAVFRTHPGGGADQRVRFAVVTGMNYAKFHHTGDGEDPTVAPKSPPYDGPDKALGYPGLKAILDAGADYFVATGDNVYYDTPRVGRAQTLHDLRRKHQEQYSQQRFLDLFLQVSSYWMKDDHDYRFNDSDPYTPFMSWPKLLVDERQPSDYFPRYNPYPRVIGSGFEPSHELGVYVFREQYPVVDMEDPEGRTYRTYRVSDSLQIWFLEGRDYRSPNDMPDGPNKSIWGAKQKAWLKDTLSASDARFKILFSPTPLVGPDSAAKRDNHANPTGFRHEGDAFFAWLSQNGFSGDDLFIVCGDRHWKYHARHPSGIEEFSSGALTDSNSLLGIHPGDKGSSDPEGKIRHLWHNEEATGGFLLITLEPGDPATLEFRFLDERGRELYVTSKGG